MSLQWDEDSERLLLQRLSMSSESSIGLVLPHQTKTALFPLGMEKHTIEVSSLELHSLHALCHGKSLCVMHLAKHSPIKELVIALCTYTCATVTVHGDGH